MSDKLVLSPSGLSTWNTCRRRWFYQYVKQWRGRGSLSAAFGSSLHAALDVVWLIATHKPYPELDAEDCIGFACDAFDKQMLDSWPRDFPDDERLYTPERGHSMIRGYVEERWDTLIELELLGCEESLYIDYPDIGASLGGRVDKVFRGTDGHIRLCDHKTSKAGSGKSGLYESFWAQFIVNRQVDVYLLAARKRWPREEIVGITIDALLVNTAAQHFEQRLFSRSKAVLDEMEFEFREAVRDIAEANARNHFPRAMNDACQSFGGCAHRAVCVHRPSIKELPDNPPPEAGDALEVVLGTTAERLGIATGDKA